jgi:hypothetical protein
MKHVLIAFILCLLLAAPAMAGVTIGLPADSNTGNCYPFGCAYNGEYQQVYNNGQFGGTITITSLEFFNTQVNYFNPSTMNSGSWTISLSTTSADWNSLDPTFANNIGGNNTVVFSGNLFQPWSFPKTLQINLSTPFTYDPLAGNLLMDVVVSGATNTHGDLYFDTNGYNSVDIHNGYNTFLGRVYNLGEVNSGYGLVTGFNQPVSSTPEPSTLLTLGSGILGLAGLARKRLS